MTQEDDEIKREIPGGMKKMGADDAMRARALGGQTRADEPPAEPDGYNLENPDPGFVFVREGGKVRRRRKDD